MKIYIKINEWDVYSNALIVQFGSDTIHNNVDDSPRLAFYPHTNFPNANSAEEIVKYIGIHGMSSIVTELRDLEYKKEQDEKLSQKIDTILSLTNTYHEFDANVLVQFSETLERMDTGDQLFSTQDIIKTEEL